MLNGLQGLACRASTGAISSTPLLALESLLSLPPLQSIIFGSVCSVAFRLRSLGASNTFETVVGHREILSCYNSLLPEIDMVNDRLLPEFKFGKLFKMVLPSRDTWLSNELIFQPNDSIVFFVDGARYETSSGIGIFCPS